MNETEFDPNTQDVNDNTLVAIADGQGSGFEEEDFSESSPAQGVIAGLSFRNKRGVFTLRQNEFELREGQGVVVKTNRGREFATVKYLGLNKEIDRGRDLRIFEIIRIADENDLATEERNRAQELHSQSICMGRVEALGLRMRIVRTEQIFDASRIVFYFVAPQKVDFRELVRQLASEFRTRIELRQINSREHVAMMGAVGACGRQTCCSSFLTKTPSVSMDMVETQSLGKNPGKLNGVCGRLKCCISYENDFYREALEGIPTKSSCVGCSSGKKGRVCGVNVVKEEVQIRLEDDSYITVSFDEIRHKKKIDDEPRRPKAEPEAEKKAVSVEEKPLEQQEAKEPAREKENRESPRRQRQRRTENRSEEKAESQVTQEKETGESPRMEATEKSEEENRPPRRRRNRRGPRKSRNPEAGKPGSGSEQ